jgi:hypothetical protein
MLDVFDLLTELGILESPDRPGKPGSAMNRHLPPNGFNIDLHAVVSPKVSSGALDDTGFNCLHAEMVRHLLPAAHLSIACGS